MTQEAAIEQCRALIGNLLGWGDAAFWTNEDFDTRYAGFDGWRDFVHRSAPPLREPSAAAPSTAPSAPPPALAPATRRKSITPIIIFTTALAALLSLLSARMKYAGKFRSPCWASSAQSSSLYAIKAVLLI